MEAVLTGPEVSLFAISGGRAMVPVAAACDYKRAGDDDRGPNTGGMGAYSPPAGFPSDLLDVVREHTRATIQTAEQYNPPFDDVFVRLMEQAGADSAAVLR